MSACGTDTQLGRLEVGIFRKRPVEVDAIQLRALLNLEELQAIARWCGGRISEDPPGIAIDTLEGTMVALEGDWIIRGLAGEFYPCKPDIFDRTYERRGTRAFHWMAS